MKFRFVLWMLGRMLRKASQQNPAMQAALKDKALEFTLQTFDGSVARSFSVDNQRISSSGGRIEQPLFVMSFRDAAYGYRVMTGKKKQQAFMQGIQDKDIRVEGNLAEVIWFQGILKHLGKPRS